MIEIELKNGEKIYYDGTITIGDWEDVDVENEQRHSIIIPDKLMFENYVNKNVSLRELIRTFNFDNLIADRN